MKQLLRKFKHYQFIKNVYPEFYAQLECVEKDKVVLYGIEKNNKLLIVICIQKVLLYFEYSDNTKITEKFILEPDTVLPIYISELIPEMKNGAQLISAPHLLELLYKNYLQYFRAYNLKRSDIHLFFDVILQHANLFIDNATPLVIEGSSKTWVD